MDATFSEQAFQFLSGNPLFAGLPELERLALASALQEREFPGGTVLLTEGSSTEHFSLVMDGEVEIVKSLGTPDERIMAVDGPGRSGPIRRAVQASLLFAGPCLFRSGDRPAGRLPWRNRSKEAIGTYRHINTAAPVIFPSLSSASAWLA